MYQRIRSFQESPERPGGFNATSFEHYCVSASFDLSQLSTTGLRVLGYVGRHMEGGMVLLNVIDVQNEFGLKSLEPVYRGIGSLMACGVLARKGKEEYWVNNSIIQKL